MRVLCASHDQPRVVAGIIMLASGNTPHTSFQLADGVIIPQVFYILSCGFVLE